jgi:hypothetical protein
VAAAAPRDLLPLRQSDGANDPVLRCSQGKLDCVKFFIEDCKGNATAVAAVRFASVLTASARSAVELLFCVLLERRA